MDGRVDFNIYNTNNEENFFSIILYQRDTFIDKVIGREFIRQQDEIELIASENIVSQAVLDATGSVLTNKYAEGYPGRRYYGGCQHVDEIESVAMERACSLFQCNFSNVQPNSGSQANQGVLLALAKPGDIILGLSLDAGGHLTHGAKPNLSGKWFTPVNYGVKRSDNQIDFDQVETLARLHRPVVIIAGGSAYPRQIDFARFRRIADQVGAYLMVDMAHFAGLVATGLYPNPFPHAHVVTSTTHKTLRGPRGGIILTQTAAMAKKINSAIFPGLQGGPLMHIIAGKAVAFGEAMQPSFKVYTSQVIQNAQVLASHLLNRGYEMVSGGTDTHLVLVDLSSKGLKGNDAESALGRAHITCNKNSIPFDLEKPMLTSGIRLGTPAATTRGFGEAEFRQIGDMIVTVLDGLAKHGPEKNLKIEAEIKADAIALCRRFPIYLNK
jgi:glycine hydroxymethyltransferase